MRCLVPPWARLACLLALAPAAGPAGPADAADPLRYGRPDHFRPFRYRYSTEDLRDKLSQDLMDRAEAEWREIDDVNARGPWKPVWRSLDQHAVPEWFLDAKLGIALNWGLYSVPAWDARRPNSRMYPDAYGSWMYGRQSHLDYHARNWGPDFGYDDFFALFSAENYDPKALCTLFSEVGAGYVVPFSKHHDGVAWWDSDWTRRSFARMGPRRDLVTPLVRQARKRHLKVALYCCWEEYANVLLGADGGVSLRDWGLSGSPRLVPLSDASRRRVSGNIPVHDYYTQYMGPLIKEMIDRFDPDGLWLDGEWSAAAEILRGRELAAYYYNQADGRKQVFVNDRLGQGCRTVHGDFSTSEFHTTRSLARPWEEIRSISHSYAYNHEDTDETVLSREQLVHMLIDIVSHNGNLLLIMGPDRTGRIPDLQMDRLQALGDWMSVNAEAIHETRILAPHQDGSVHFTRDKGGHYAYAICTEWPGERLRLEALRAEVGSRIHMLGVAEPLDWTQDDEGLRIAIPAVLQEPTNRPCKHAWAIRIPMEPRVLVGRRGLSRVVELATLGGPVSDVRYTLDGAEPTAQSAAYAGPIELDPGSTVTIAARAFRAGNPVGQVASAVVATSSAVPPKPDVYLDALDPTSFVTGWQAQGVTTWRKVNCHGTPLSVRGVVFRRGVGMHANGEVVFPVERDYGRFVCRVGIDDRANGAGSVKVSFYLDQALLTRTPVLTGRDELWNVDVALPEAADEEPRTLRIAIEDNQDGIHGDNADLVDAGFVARTR